MKENELKVLGRLLFYIRKKVYKLTRMQLNALSGLHITQIARMENCDGDHICDLSGTHVALIRAMGIEFTEFYNIVEQMTSSVNTQLQREATLDEIDAVIAYIWVFGDKPFQSVNDRRKS